MTANRSKIGLLLMVFLLLFTACAKESDSDSTQVTKIMQIVQTTQAMGDQVSIPETVSLNFSETPFSKKELPVLADDQIGSIVSKTVIDEGVVYGQYLPKIFDEETPEGYTYTYIAISGTVYALSQSLGEGQYGLDKFPGMDAVYVTNAVQGAGYGVTIFLKIDAGIPSVFFEADGLAQFSDIDGDGIVEAVSAVGTVQDVSVYRFDFENQVVYTAQVNEQSGAIYAAYDVSTDTFRLIFEPGGESAAYAYEGEGQLRYKGPGQTAITEDAINTYLEETSESVYKIESEAFANKVITGEDVFIIDLRSETDYASSHVKGAINKSFNSLAAGDFSSIPTDKPIFIYCYSGKTSAQASAILNMVGLSAKSVDLGWNFGLSKFETIMEP